MNVYSSPDKTSGYRADIDGLRAIAVLGVVAYHAFPGWLPGGFVGVDVFFVISGYLITSLVGQDINAGRFSIVNFYARRIRRIFPALILMLLAVWGLGYALMMPGEFAELGSAMLHSAYFANNFLLVAQAGYFDQAAELKPLLHLWSLSVEEQFYIVWPYVLIVLLRQEQRIGVRLVALLGLSFVAALWASAAQPVSAFYLPQYRAWELIAGAILALKGEQWKRYFSEKQLEMMGWGGLALILAAFALIQPVAGYPGWRALAPVLGAAWVVFAGLGRAGRYRMLLTHPAMIAVGLISYPLYLWHWPLLAIGRTLFGELSVGLTWALILAAMLLSWASWRLLEIPVRRADWQRWSPRTVVAMGLLILVMLGVTGDRTKTGRGFPERVPGDAWQELLWSKAEIRDEQCLAELGVKGDYCLRGSLGPVTHALIGDSHANHFFFGLAPALARQAGNLLQLQGPSKLEGDLAWSNIDWLLSHREIGVVVVAYHQGRIREQDNPYGSVLETMAARLLAGGKQVFFVLDNPGFDTDPRLCSARPAFARKLGAGNDPERICVETVDYMRRKRALYENYVASLLARYPEMGVIDAFSPLCDKERCSIFGDGHLLYRDRHHLTIYGAQRLFASLPASLASSFSSVQHKN